MAMIPTMTASTPSRINEVDDDLSTDVGRGVDVDVDMAGGPFGSGCVRARWQVRSPYRGVQTATAASPRCGYVLNDWRCPGCDVGALRLSMRTPSGECRDGRQGRISPMPAAGGSRSRVRWRDQRWDWDRRGHAG